MVYLKALSWHKKSADSWIQTSRLTTQQNMENNNNYKRRTSSVERAFIELLLLVFTGAA